MKTKNIITQTFILLASFLSLSAQISKRIPLDSLQSITITKLIYYQKPLIIKKGDLTDKTYIPIWYDAQCAISNSEKFKKKYAEKAHLFQKRLGVKEDVLSRNDMDTAIQNKSKRFYNKWPLTYYFAEIWLTINSTNEKIVLTLNSIKEKEFSDVKFKNPEKNNSKEFDESGAYLSPVAFIFEDATLKFGDQMYIMNEFNSDESVWINFDLKSIKDVLYRSKIYIRSNVINGKRIFETIENTPNGIVVISTSDKP